MSYPESLKEDDYTKEKYLEVIKHIPPTIFEQYLIKFSKVAKITNHNDKVRELEKGAIYWEMGERLDMNMVNVGEYIIAETPFHHHDLHSGWMFLIAIERDGSASVGYYLPSHREDNFDGHHWGIIRYIQLGWSTNLKKITIMDSGIREHGIIDNGWSGSRNLYFYRCPKGFDFINWNTTPFNSIK